nr:Uncharacterised protein [Klebsiella pneumoniae]
MSIHLHEISESVLLIRRRTATGLVKNKSQTAAGMADAAVVSLKGLSNDQYRRFGVAQN